MVAPFCYCWLDIQYYGAKLSVASIACFCRARLLMELTTGARLLGQQGARLRATFHVDSRRTETRRYLSAYSERSASSGCKRLALNAGIDTAARTTIDNVIGTATKTTLSLGAIPYSIDASKPAKK